jgi:DNA-binding NtrC family response regulator
MVHRDDHPDDASTLMQRSYDPVEASDVAFVLRVSSGADVGASITVDDGVPSTLLIGSSPVCALRLNDRQVSRRHAAVAVVGGMLQLIDARSTNGTRVNGLRVGEVFLGGGETIQLGETVLSVERASKTGEATVAFTRAFGRMVGGSREMRRLYPLCARLATSTVPLIIEGETGTGKEALAESLHSEGPRADGPFVVFDCTAVAPNLLEAELFGHERGAFTGAVASHRGVFEQAHGGTLMIDEIGDLDLHLQPKLLRAIERSEIRRVGGEKSIRVDVRIIAATRRDLDREIEAGRFRDDLFHRLAVARIELPPLRERRGDVTELTLAFCRELGADPNELLRSELFARWQAYRWPGNVRELRNAVVRYAALGELGEFAEAKPSARGVVAGDDLVGAVLAQGLPLAASRKLVVEQFEQRYVEHVLDKHDGVVTHAAKAAGIARRHFYRVGQRGPQR